MEPIRLWHLTDSHLVEDTEAVSYGVNTFDTLSTVVGDAADPEKRPDLILHTGDLADDGKAATYVHARSLFSKLNIPTLVTPGNHDDLGLMTSSFEGSCVEVCDSYSTGNWLVLLVNSQVTGKSHGNVSASALAQLEKKITESPDQHIAVALHHSPLLQCRDRDCQLENRDELLDLLKQHKNVRCLLAGHTHDAKQLDKAGMTVMTTPSTFAQVTHPAVGADGECHTLNASRFGYRSLELYADGRVVTEIRWFPYDAPSDALTW